MTYTTQNEVRAAFWNQLPDVSGYYTSKRQNQQPCDVRCAFVDFVDHLAQDNQISEALAQRVTL